MQALHVLVVQLLLLWAARGEIHSSHSNSTKSNISVSKCCPLNAVMVEAQLGVRQCVGRSKLQQGVVTDSGIWFPSFYNPETEIEEERPPGVDVKDGLPQCDVANGEYLFPVLHHETTIDDFLLLSNGSLAHKHVHRGEILGEKKLYNIDKYCLDDLIITHNFSHTLENGEETEGPKNDLIEFGYICVKNEVGLQKVIDNYVYPIGLSVSVMCMILTFLLYCFLPQLRDLSGKFILAICSFMSAALTLMIVDLFGWKDPNVDKFVTEFLLHVSVLGVWLSLNSMGHHTWKIILSKSVFTRVTDGQRLLYYSIYVVAVLIGITGIALAAHFIMGHGQGVGDLQVGWECLGVLYGPVVLILLVNVYFYFTAQRKMSRQLAYNRSMQHFQVNFDLYIKFLLVIGVWWLFFMLSLLQLPSLIYIARLFHIIQGPLIFCVAMCRTRVAFLFKKYFCLDACLCCSSGPEHDFIEEDCKELSVIDGLRRRQEKEDEAACSKPLLMPFTTPKDTSEMQRELSKSLFNVRHQTGEVPPPENLDVPMGRVKRLLKSNSLTAIANINFGWRRETSV